ncbi:transcriptional regulator [Paenibacillus sp. CCS19]|uniref:ArsR/SmtB family transcription factor n=1 Tax=Paenibacillus sp. CCS19 TaxID=3158387 RepID=UPI00255D6870|nr:ArsR family transcriptional regulator [Paenibacillus cellulosilyticus]GMK41930.1 transcriptional regulator [Paenibacillus cellulosilyticus]
MLELDINEPDKLVTVAHALSTRARVEILRLLNQKSLNIVEIAEALKLPVSSVANHVRVLEGAWLIQTELLPAVRGAMKVCTRTYHDVHMQLNTSFLGAKGEEQVYEIDMPVGHYTDCEVAPTCGMADGNGLLIPADEPASFYHPRHVSAQLIWFRRGYLEYRFPLEIPPNSRITALEFTMELCSEAPNYDNNWPSDITVSVNGVDIGTWTSPGDFGDRRGRLNPAWWGDHATQYGLRKIWRVDDERSMVDMHTVSDVTLAQLELASQSGIRLRIGVGEDANHKGGINIFGRQFGDYEQDIQMRVHFITE